MRRWGASLPVFQGSLLTDPKESLSELDLAFILDEDLLDDAIEFALDLVHHLHGLDNAKDLSFLDGVADADERLFTGGRASVENTYER